VADASSLFAELADACDELKQAPPSMVRRSVHLVQHLIDSEPDECMHPAFYASTTASHDLAAECIRISAVAHEPHATSRPLQRSGLGARFCKTPALSFCPCACSQKYEASADVLAAMKALKEAGALAKWGKVMDEGLQRRNIFLGNLRQASAQQSRAPGTLRRIARSLEPSNLLDSCRKICLRWHAGVHKSCRNPFQLRNRTDSERWHIVKPMFPCASRMTGRHQGPGEGGDPVGAQRCGIPVHARRRHQRARGAGRPAAGRLGAPRSHHIRHQFQVRLSLKFVLKF